ncbi:MAG: ATP-binding cassette domain-containing protein [Planctomycetota bacterium]
MNPVGIDLEEVQYTYRDGTRALAGVTASILPGRRVGIVGPNGAGKSTLLLAIAGVLDHQGRIRVGDTEVSRANLKTVRSAVGLVFQDADDQLFMPTVMEDVAFGPLNMGVGPEDALARSHEALDEVGLSPLAQKAPYNLSGGQKKLASIATVLSMRPGVLALDEPSGALDHRSRRAVIEALRGFQVTQLIATHDLELLVELADEVIVLDAGKLVVQGDARRVLADRSTLARHGLEAPHSLLHLAPSDLPHRYARADFP